MKHHGRLLDSEYITQLEVALWKGESRVPSRRRKSLRPLYSTKLPRVPDALEIHVSTNLKYNGVFSSSFFFEYSSEHPCDNRDLTQPS